MRYLLCAWFLFLSLVYRGVFIITLLVGSDEMKLEMGFNVAYYDERARDVLYEC